MAPRVVSRGTPSVIPDSQEEEEAGDNEQQQLPDSDSDVEIVGEHSGAPSGAAQGSSLGPHQSPAEQQRPAGLGRDGAKTAARQLYLYGVCEDEAATAARKRQLEITGKAPVIEQPVKPEQDSRDRLQHDAEPTQDDIEALAAELQDNPDLLQRLMNAGEGCSSNAAHVWRQRVFHAYLKQQEDLLSEAQQQQQQEEQEEQQQHSDHQDTGAPAVDLAQPAAKRRRTTLPAAPAGSGDGAGSSTPAAPPPQQQQPGPPLSLPRVQQQRSQRQPRAASQQQQQQAKPRAAGAAPAAAAAGAAAGAAGGGSDNPSGRVLQSNKERQRKLRRKLSQVEALAALNRDKLVDSSRGDLRAVLFDLESLGDMVERPREGAQHAGVLSAVLRDGVAMINAFNSTTRGRAPEQLTAALKMLFAADPAAAFTSSSHHDISAINWLQLGAASAPLFRGVSGVGSMLGALASEAKARPARVVRQKRAAPEPEVRPLDGAEALAEAGEAHGLAQETQRVVTEMRRQLRAVGCASAVRLVLDHDSFAHTVENVFALSFLCKDLWVRLEAHKEQGLLVHHVTEQQHEQLKNKQQTAGAAAGTSLLDRLSPHQFIMPMDMQTWRDMCALVPRGQALMPPRRTTTHD